MESLAAQLDTQVQAGLSVPQCPLGSGACTRPGLQACVCGCEETQASARRAQGRARGGTAGLPLRPARGSPLSALLLTPPRPQSSVQSVDCLGGRQGHKSLAASGTSVLAAGP